MTAHARPGRRLGALAAGAVLVQVLAACTSRELTAPEDAEPRDDPPVQATAAPEAEPAPTLAGDPRWAAPYSSPPRPAGDGFVGIAMSEGGDLTFLGVDAEGRTRWSTPRNPSCTAFAVTEDESGQDLVVLLDSDADPASGLLATRTTAAAYDPHDGSLVWGPTDVPGTLVGPGLLLAAIEGSVMSSSSGPKVALDPETGAVSADEEEDGTELLHEYQGTLLVREGGELRASESGSGDVLWTSGELDPPEHTGSGPDAVAPGPAPENGYAASVALSWEDPDGEPVAHTVHDLRTGERLVSFHGREEPRVVGNKEDLTVVSGPHPDGGQLLVGLRGSPAEELWRTRLPDGPRLDAVVGDHVHLTDGDLTRLVEVRSGETVGEGPWAVPVAAAADGTALVPVGSEGLGDAFAAFAPAP
ncbi:hypothetical protein GCM10007147_21130 [Nocardiopsis kunsanensis]|uniref:Uncharacterized protein n=1 Tax=Nocardiopsis kunsanensis TaxID=141693 RepID=A0A919CH76_9ACTN|nr:PQQ-binding-like beta-propeller repeat protein [Nocardiopsis kunsanensis]GHD24708.1 hypothetical protein GCM10007147_21130 [Nocardiopsis kunsanensis]